jgi:cytochrome P450
VRKFLQEELVNSGLVHQASELARDSILQTLPFLQACIWEALRTHPPLHLLDAQLTMEDVVSLWAYRIPNGTSVVLNYNACLNAACFTPIVHTFQPERWMIDDLDELMDMRRHVDIVWGKAPSQRLTVDIACMQLRKLVFNVSLPSFQII